MPAPVPDDFGHARIFAALILTAAAVFIVVISPFVPDYDPDTSTVVALLVASGALLGVEVLDNWRKP